jgi:PKD repeat protein
VFQADVLGRIEPYITSWDFDDGSEEGEEQIILHTFDEAGTYNVTLTITDSEDQTASDSIEITVEEPSAEEEQGEEAEVVVEEGEEGEQV